MLLIFSLLAARLPVIELAFFKVCANAPFWWFINTFKEAVVVKSASDILLRLWSMEAILFFAEGSNTEFTLPVSVSMVVMAFLTSSNKGSTFVNTSLNRPACATVGMVSLFFFIVYALPKIISTDDVPNGLDFINATELEGIVMSLVIFISTVMVFISFAGEILYTVPTCIPFIKTGLEFCRPCMF